VVVLAKDSATASKLQKATQRRLIGKRYLAILTGELAGPVTVDQPLGPDPDSCVTIRSKVVAADSFGAQAAVTHFEPVAARGGFTLARIRLETGRKHQIRAHALWLGHAVVSAFTSNLPSTAGRSATRRCCRFRVRRCIAPRSTFARPMSPTSSGRRWRRS
jgi:23S rRNA-/tRNA-specific pseudouridylate synthase